MYYIKYKSNVRGETIARLDVLKRLNLYFNCLIDKMGYVEVEKKVWMLYGW